MPVPNRDISKATDRRCLDAELSSSWSCIFFSRICAARFAGSKVTEGEINSTSDVRIIRDGAIIYTGKVSTIFREKNQVKQVSDGQECGITVKDYMDFQKNDTIEAFSVTSTERSI